MGNLDLKVTLPDPESIILRMSTVSNETNLVEKLYPQIARYAGRELNTAGVLMMVTLAVTEFAKGYPPPASGIVKLLIPQWVDVLIDNEEAAGASKEFFKLVDAEQKADYDALKAARINPVDPLEDDVLYSAIMQIKKIFFEEVKRADNKDLWIGKSKHEGVNPYYSQTASGLFVEFYYGHPSKVWTPWGYWQFTWGCSYSGNPWKDILPPFLERLGATLFVPETNMDWGVYGPVYAVSKVDKLVLPAPKTRADEGQNFLEYEVANKAWKSMAKRYNSIGAKVRRMVAKLRV